MLLRQCLAKNKEAADLSSWKIIYDRFCPVDEGLREALCTLGNGYFATRGAAEEAVASRIHYPGTYIAGVYNKLETHLAGRVVVNEDLVNCPNWLFLTMRMGSGEWVGSSTSKILAYYQELDLRRGVLIRKIKFQDCKGHKVTIETRRIVSMADHHCAAVKYVITPENYHGPVVIRSALDGSVQNTGVARYRQLNSKHLKACSLGRFHKNGVYLLVKTSQSGIEIAQSSKLNIFTVGQEIKPEIKVSARRKKTVYQEFILPVRKRQRYEIEKIVSVYTSKDQSAEDLLTAAGDSVKIFGWETLFRRHKHAWDRLWQRFDIKVRGDTFIQRGLRLHAFHLLQTASMHNRKIDVGLPARGLHGEAYRGHIFWDNLFIMPFFDLRAPEISKALLLYRYRRLPPARRAARQTGYKGAMFPWQSGSIGEEETQVMHLNPISGKWGPDYSHHQRHVSFVIAYNVWWHWINTGDLDFLSRYGAEIILSIAQFGASLAYDDSKDRRYHTEGIMGPDEFHERIPGAAKAGFRDNAYTNLLIVWTLCRAREVLDIVPREHKERLLEKLNLEQEELTRWEDITRRMNIIICNGIISQFDGYFKLKELNWDFYRMKYGNIQRLDRILKAEGKSPNEYKVAKQADVLMIFYLFPPAEIKDLFCRLGYNFDRGLLRRNYEYYIKRTSHGSTLSKVVHGYVAHLLGKSKESWQWFMEVLKSDIYDTQGGTTPEGIHTGVMGGSIDMMMRCFAGVNILADRLKINPKLFKHWQNIELRFYYRGKEVFLSIAPQKITILIRGPKETSIPVEVYGKRRHLVCGRTYKIVSP